jgi:hypothetical protein
MEIELKYVVQAIKVLHEAKAALQSGTAEQRGRAAGHCISAAIDLEVRIGDTPVELIEVTP